ncbi:MAG: lysophospholipid acyltransferase family protein [Planctomycetota bacterium]
MVKFRKPWQHRWIGRLGNLLIRSLGATWRTRSFIHVPPEPGIYLFLHGNILACGHTHRDRDYTILISTHRDGEVIAQIAQRLGLIPVRGSSTRGGAKAVLELLRDYGDRPFAITPDGPRGPRGSVKPSLIQLAAKGGWKIFPMGFATDRAWRFNSWDRFTIPKPFARVVSVLGDPMIVPADVDRDDATRLAEQMTIRMFEAEELAEAQIANWNEHS